MSDYQPVFRSKLNSNMIFDTEVEAREWDEAEECVGNVLSLLRAAASEAGWTIHSSLRDIAGDICHGRRDDLIKALGVETKEEYFRKITPYPEPPIPYPPPPVSENQFDEEDKAKFQAAHDRVMIAGFFSWV